MKQVAVYMMLVLGGNANPTKEDVTKAMSAVGIEVDDARLTQLLKDLEGKDLNELLESGKALLSELGTGTGGGGGSGGDAAGGGAAEEVEEVKEEEEEIDMGGGMDMFGGEAVEGGDY
jgi:large subunit ribosomal protein LP2